MVDSRAHRIDVCIIKTERLQVGEAPVAVAECRPQFDGVTISCNRFVELTDGLECVAAAQHDLCLRGKVGEQVIVTGQRPFKVTHPDEYRGPLSQVRRFIRVFLEQAIHLCKCFLEFFSLAQNIGIIQSREAKVRRQFQAACQQVFCVGVDAYLDGYLCQKPDRSNIVRAVLQ